MAAVPPLLGAAVKLGGSGVPARPAPVASPALLAPAIAPLGNTTVLSGTRLILTVYARFHERLAGIVSTKLKEAPPESFEKGGKIKVRGKIKKY